MHHLVTEWVTLPALFTWLGEAQDLVLISTCSSGCDRLPFIFEEAALSAPSRSDPASGDRHPRRRRCARQVSPVRPPRTVRRSAPGGVRSVRGGRRPWSSGTALIGQSVSQESDRRPCGPCQGCLQNRDLQRGQHREKGSLCFTLAWYCSNIGLGTLPTLQEFEHLEKFSRLYM